MQASRINTIKTLVLIGMLAASITGGKLAVAIPNVEIVTLLIILYTAVFGLKIALPAVMIFVAAETLIYGVGTWVISYYIYWCGLSAVTFAAGKAAKEKFFVYPVIAAVMSVFFGVLTTFVDTLFAAGRTSFGFFEIFSMLYIRGIRFFLLHIISNTLIVGFAFVPLRAILVKLKNGYFGAAATKTS